MKFVFDASAVLAILNQESGAAKATRFLDGAGINAVNRSEVLKKLIERRTPVPEAVESANALGLQIVTFDDELALASAALWPITRSVGLSFADRCCVATAIAQNATAITADRAWAMIDLPCNVEVIR